MAKRTNGDDHRVEHWWWRSSWGSTMSETRAPTALSLLDYLLDEVRATAGLLRVADLARKVRRPWWRNVAFGLARTPTEVSADLGVQYLGQNIDRARDHWRGALVHCDELRETFPTNGIVVALVEKLENAGSGDVLSKLQHDVIPGPIADAAVQLSAVVDTIRECDRLVVAARNRLMLQRMRDESPHD
jgi:hypothetical protein